MSVPRRRSRPLLLVSVPAALAALAGLTGCSEDTPSALPSGSAPPATATSAPAPTTSTAAPTPTPTVGTPRSPVRWLGPAAAGPAGEVQRATRGYWSMVVRLAERPDPADPALTALTLPPQRTQLITVFTGNRANGVSQRGPIDGTVTVGQVAGSTATAQTCLDQTLVKVYERTGRARPGSSGSRSPFTVQLRKDAGGWKVHNVTGGTGTCTIPR